MENEVEEFGFTEVIREHCGTCNKVRNVAVLPLDPIEQIKLCSDCLVDLANLVNEATPDSAKDQGNGA